MNERAGISINARWRSIVNVALLLSNVIACSKTSEGAADPGTDSSSHWLIECESDAECGAELSCYCGHCTIACDSDAQCEAHAPSSRCSSTPESCGTGAGMFICGVESSLTPEAADASSPTTDSSLGPQAGSDGGSPAASSESQATATSLDAGVEPARTVDPGAETSSGSEPASAQDADASSVSDSESASAQSDAGVDLAEPAPLNDGLAASIGSVHFDVLASTSGRYCGTRNGGVLGSAWIEDSSGHGFPASWAHTCGTQDECSLCQEPEALGTCGTTDVYYPRVYFDADVVVWDGVQARLSTCQGELGTIGCVEPSYALAGHYTLHYCAFVGEPYDSAPDECTPTGGRDCVAFEFDYSGDQQFDIALPEAGDGSDPDRFACGNTICAAGSYCVDSRNLAPNAFACEPLPDGCKDDPTCTCLQPVLAATATCSANPDDTVYSVVEYPETR